LNSTIRRASWRAFLTTAVIAMFGLGLSAPVHAQDPPDFKTSWGSKGTGNGQFESPFDLATDSGGNVYVTDVSLDRVQKFNKDGIFIKKWGISGEAADPLQEGHLLSAPMGISIDKSNRLVLGDAHNDRVKIQDTNGNLIKMWGGWTPNLLPGKFYVPRSVTQDPFGNIYVWDRWERIQRFTADGSFVLQWMMPDDFGLGGSGTNGASITSDPGGNIFATSCESNRVIKYSPLGFILDQWGTKGSGAGRFDCPKGISSDRKGNVYVVDGNNSRVQMFAPDHKFLTQWSSTGKPGGQFVAPHGIHVDGRDNVFITDTGTDKVHKFSFDPPLP